MSAPAVTLRDAFAEDVARGLAQSPKTLEPRFFYDDLGSLLFEAITRLPWYPITRAEFALLTRSAGAILDAAGRPPSLIELGSGSGEKAAILVEEAARHNALAVHLIDLSEMALSLATRTLGLLQSVRVTTHQAAFEEGLARASAKTRGGARLVLFLGSNLGNFDFLKARLFLQEIRSALAPGDTLLLGTDLVKSEERLLLAYDDPLGVTAAFNKNLLLRMNRELGADFDLASFRHRAIWNPVASRMEMYLVSQRTQRVVVPGAGLVVSLAEGESIFTECSYKYEEAPLRALVTGAGFETVTAFRDDDAAYALTLFRAAV